jgi:hypothetical protein
MNIRAVGYALRSGLAFGLALLVGSVSAQPFAGADLENGKTLHFSKGCAGCHAEKTLRDESFMYLRSDRRVKTLFDLRRMVSVCNMQLKADLFPEDERDIAAYLNQQYYKLDK